MFQLLARRTNMTVEIIERWELGAFNNGSVLLPGTLVD